MKLSKMVRAAGAAVVLSAALMMNVRGDEAAQKVKVAELGGAERCLTFVSTDKPIYRPGEKLYVRAALLNAMTHAPSADNTPALVEVSGPRVTRSLQDRPAQEGVFGFAWEIPTGTAGGEYTVKVSHPYSGFAPGVRKFDIRAYRAPRLKSQIVFVRDGYGPGDTVSASVHVDRAEGGVPANAKVSVIARLDGAEISNTPATIDGKGNASAQFKLPADISQGKDRLRL